jgi:general secretion pathway protein L
MSSRIWGLDLGSTGIKAVELSRTVQGHRVTQYGFLPIRSGEREEYLQGLRKIFPEGEKGREGIVVPIASHRMMVHRVSLPFQDRKKNRQVVKFEVEPLLPFPVEQVVVDFYIPPEREDGNLALVFAVRKEDLSEQLSLLHEAGLDPESVVSEAMALFWMVKRLRQSASASALLDVGHEKTTMIVWRGETLGLVRSIPIAGAAMSQALPGELKIDPGEGMEIKEGGEDSVQGQEGIPVALGRLADEVQRTLIPYESGPGGRPVEEVFLTGGSAALPGVEKILSGLLRRSVAVLDVPGHLPSLLRDVPPEYHNALTTALGAAFGGWVGEAERINFRQEEFASSRKAQKLKTRLTLLLSYVAVLAFLGVAAFSANLYLKEKRYKDLKAEIRKEFLQSQPGVKKVVNELQQMKNRVREEKARLDALGGLTSASSPLAILREISMMIEPTWKVRITDLVMDPEAVEVSGEADSFDAVDRFKAKLDRSPLYKEVQLKTARASTLENVVEFKFQMKRGM